jgi:hypothetical protein
VVTNVEVYELVHFVKADNDAAVHGYGAAREARARSAWRDWYTVSTGPARESGDLGTRAWTRDREGLASSQMKRFVVQVVGRMFTGEGDATFD